MTKKKEIKRIPLDKAHIVHSPGSQTSFTVEIPTSNERTKIYELEAADIQERMQWVNAIQLEIDQKISKFFQWRTQSGKQLLVDHIVPIVITLDLKVVETIIEYCQEEVKIVSSTGGHRKSYSRSQRHSRSHRLSGFFNANPIEEKTYLTGIRISSKNAQMSGLLLASTSDGEKLKSKYFLLFNDIFALLEKNNGDVMYIFPIETISSVTEPNGNIFELTLTCSDKISTKFILKGSTHIDCLRWVKMFHEVMKKNTKSGIEFKSLFWEDVNKILQKRDQLNPAKETYPYKGVILEDKYITEPYEWKVVQDDKVTVLKEDENGEHVLIKMKKKHGWIPRNYVGHRAPEVNKFVITVDIPKNPKLKGKKSTKKRIKLIKRLSEETVSSAHLEGRCSKDKTKADRNRVAAQRKKTEKAANVIEKVELARKKAETKEAKEDKMKAEAERLQMKPKNSKKSTNRDERPAWVKHM